MRRLVWWIRLSLRDFGVLNANIKPKTILRSDSYLAVHSILKCVNEPAATSYGCQNRDTRAVEFGRGLFHEAFQAAKPLRKPFRE